MKIGPERMAEPTELAHRVMEDVAAAVEGHDFAPEQGPEILLALVSVMAAVIRKNANPDLWHTVATVCHQHLVIGLDHEPRNPAENAS